MYRYVTIVMTTSGYLIKSLIRRALGGNRSRILLETPWPMWTKIRNTQISAFQMPVAKTYVPLGSQGVQPVVLPPISDDQSGHANEGNNHRPEAPKVLPVHKQSMRQRRIIQELKKFSDIIRY